MQHDLSLRLTHPRSLRPRSRGPHNRRLRPHRRPHNLSDRSDSQLPDRRNDQVDILLARAPVDDRRPETDLASVNSGPEVDPPVLEHEVVRRRQLVDVAERRPRRADVLEREVLVDRGRIDLARDSGRGDAR